ncbi:MAG: hypothetical protein RR444_06425 [Oscillospiraceae bacterium]
MNIDDKEQEIQNIESSVDIIKASIMEPTKPKMFSIYNFAGDGGLTSKGLGIFILCLTVLVGAFIIHTALQ